MERAIGEIFEIDGKKLKVVESERGESCKDCYFYLEHESCIKRLSIIGICSRIAREDNKSVVFKLLGE